MTPEQYAVDVLRHYTHILGGAPREPLFLGRLIDDAIAHAINAKLDEVAAQLEKLESGTYTTAQTPAGLVRKMKVKA